ncbi:MAG: hypothetical protein HQ591_04170 [candidate division Zixibacteria bacterium]|nr:hypothetical protein [Candidatus Tariuqbacter arcticus]
MKSLILSLIISIFVLFNQAFCVERMTIAVMELEVKGGLSANEASILTEKVREALFHTGKYTVLDRSSMDEILKEFGLSQSGCTSVECIVNVGRVLSAQNMVAGYIGKIGTTYSMALRIINVETGEIINMATVDCPGCQLEQVAANTPRDAVRKLLGEPVEEKPGKLPAKKRKYMIAIGIDHIGGFNAWGGIIYVGYKFTPNFALIAEYVNLNLVFKTEGTVITEDTLIGTSYQIYDTGDPLNALMITPRFYKKISGNHLWGFLQVKFGVFWVKMHVVKQDFWSININIYDDTSTMFGVSPGLGFHLFNEKFISINAEFGYYVIEKYDFELMGFSDYVDYSGFSSSLNVVFSF